MTAKKAKNVRNATAVGVAVGGGSAVLLNYGAAVIQQKTGVPMEVSLTVLGSVAAFFMRWAAKLNPND